MGVREAGRRRVGGNRGKERGREGDREREKHSIIASFLIYFTSLGLCCRTKGSSLFSAQLWGALLPSCGGGASSPAVGGALSLQLWGALLCNCGGGLYSLDAGGSTP